MATPHQRAPGVIGKLQDRLDAITTRTRELVQADRLARSERATAELFATGIEDRVLKAGAALPAFALNDVAGKPIRSADLLALGPLIVKFFRGRWCPYCTTELEAWRDLMPTVRQHGALLVAISPQTTRQNAFMSEALFSGVATRSRFPLLSDPGAAFADQCGLAYTVPERERRYFRSILVNIPFANSGLSYDTAPDSAWRLPLSATFVVTPAGTIAFAEAHADFHVRAEPAEVIAHLPALAR